MKKRNNITINEYAEVMKKRGYTLGPLLRDLLGEPEMTSASFDWPASFYEEPPAGSFGKFTSKDLTDRWGHLRYIADNRYVCEENEGSYATFTPGLPTDVDADGMPLGAE